MSTTIMGLCWPLEMPPTPKAVLMSLADQANDQGVCWPAVGTICRRTCLSERAVQNSIRWLAANGVLTLNREHGRATNYQLNPAGLGKGTPDLFTAPARRAPPHQVHPRTSSTTPPHDLHPTPAPGAGDPRTTCTQNHKEPSKNQKRIVKSGAFDAAAVELPEWLERDLWLRWVADRRERKKVITKEGAKLQLRELGKYREQGFTPIEVIEHSMAGGFQGLYPPTKRGGALAGMPVTDAAKEHEKSQALLAAQAKHAEEAQSPSSHAARKAAVDRLKANLSETPA